MGLIESIESLVDMKIGSKNMPKVIGRPSSWNELSNACENMWGKRYRYKKLKEIHMLGKSPVITDNGKVIIESAAISTYIIDQYAPSDFSPNKDDDDYYKYLELMHYA